MKKIIITMMVLLALTTSVFAGNLNVSGDDFEDGSHEYNGPATIDADTLGGKTLGQIGEVVRHGKIRNEIINGDDELQVQIDSVVSMDNAQNKVLRAHDADINDNTNMNNAQNKVLRAHDADINDNTNMNNAQNKVLQVNDADIKTFKSRESSYLQDRVGGGISRTTVWNMLTGQKQLYDNYEYIVEFLDTIFVSHAEMAEMELKVSALEDAIVNKDAYRTSMAKALGNYDGMMCYDDVDFCYEVN